MACCDEKRVSGLVGQKGAVVRVLLYSVMGWLYIHSRQQASAGRLGLKVYVMRVPVLYFCLSFFSSARRFST